MQNASENAPKIEALTTHTSGNRSKKGIITASPTNLENGVFQNQRLGSLLPDFISRSRIFRKGRVRGFERNRAVNWKGYRKERIRESCAKTGPPPVQNLGGGFLSCSRTNERETRICLKTLYFPRKTTSPERVALGARRVNWGVRLFRY